MSFSRIPSENLTTAVVGSRTPSLQSWTTQINVLVS
jgi:hypothetical protein